MAIINEPVRDVVNIICGGDSVTEFSFGDDEDKRWTTIASERAREILGLPVGGGGYRPAIHSGDLPGPSYEGTPADSGYGFGRLSKTLAADGDAVIWEDVVGTSFDFWYADALGQGAINLEIDGPLNPTAGYLPTLPSNEVAWCPAVAVNANTIGSAGNADLIVYFDSPDYTISNLRCSLGGFQTVLRLDLGGPSSGFNGKLMMSGIGAGTVSWNAAPVAVTGWTDGTGRWFKAHLDVATDTVTYWYSNQAKTTARASITWIQIGSAVALSTSITGLNSAGTAVIGNIDSLFGGSPWNGKVYRHCCLINGNVAWDMDFTKQLDGAWFWEDEIGNKWNTTQIGYSPAGGRSSSFTKIVQTDPCGLFVTSYESTVGPFVGEDTFVRVDLPDLSSHDIRASYYALGAGFIPTMSVSGVDPHRGDEEVGVNFIPAGHGGYQCYHFVGAGLDSKITKQVELIDPQGLVLFFGFNERGADPPFNDPEVYRGYIQDYIDAARAVKPHLPVLLIGGWEPEGSPGDYPWSDYIDALKGVETSMSHCDLLNMYELWPGPGTVEGDASGRYYDTVHLNGDVGNPDFAEVLVSAVISESALTHGIVWDNPEDRFYETGIDRGIVHVEDKDVAPWNGIIKVVEGEDGLVNEQSKFEGNSFSNLAIGGQFTFVIETFNFPDYVDECIGNYVVFPGVTLTGQRRVPFNFSYRTMVNESDYKLHFVYNCLASIKKRGTKSMTDQVDPETYEFLVTTKAYSSSIFKPTSHIVVNSAEVSASALAELEDMIYGTEDDPAIFPAPSTIIDIFA